MKNKKGLLANLVVLACAAVICVFAGLNFSAMRKDDYAYTKNPNLTEIRHLSDYCPSLKGTALDSNIYVFKGKKPGGSFLIYGGTHPNEIAASLSANLYLENAKVDQGTLYVITRANNSGFTHTTPLRAQMESLSFTLDDGSTRTFRMGTRLINPIDQWPDFNYYDGASGRELKHDEVVEMRNLNRNHPGDENGTPTERACYAIRNLITTENITGIYDGHEASPEFERVNYLIAHERAMSLGSAAIMNSNLDGLDKFRVDISGKTSYGLSHRALGDSTNTYATLFETNNPVMGGRHGKVTLDLIKEGIDANYTRLTDLGYINSGALPASGSPIEERTAYHMEMSRHLLEALSQLEPQNAVIISGMPTYNEVISKGLEGVLKPEE